MTQVNTPHHHIFVQATNVCFMNLFVLVDYDYLDSEYGMNTY